MSKVEPARIKAPEATGPARESVSSLRPSISRKGRIRGVTIGRANIWEKSPEGVPWGAAVIEEDAVLCAGAVVLIRDGGTLTVGRGTVVGANAVLTESTDEWEIWAGAPARRVGKCARPAPQ